MNSSIYDLLVIGGGINGAGIARDAAGRGLSVLLAEQDDLASATSSWSTKLIHGGLRYLEHYEFRLVAEALAEREVLLGMAPHIIAPLLFVLPHEPHLRPAWMIRIGLFLYDRLGGRMTLPRSFGTALAGSRWGAGLKPRFRKGFVYADARVDDARLVVLNALDAQARGADIRVRTRVTGARRESGLWRVQLEDGDGTTTEVGARALVNAAGPWVKQVLDTVRTSAANEDVRHVKGSHIVVPRVHAEPHAYILQNADKRIVFVIPYHEHYSLIGTTDIPVERYEHPQISADEVDYLLRLANEYLERPLTRADIVWTYSGVRPLYDDGSTDPSAVTRDYVLKVDAVTGSTRPRTRTGAVDLRRQDHDLPQARRTCARGSRPLLSGPCARMDARGCTARRGPAQSRPRGVAGRTHPSLSEGCHRRCCKRWRSGTGRGPCAYSGRRSNSPTSASISVRR